MRFSPTLHGDCASIQDFVLRNWSLVRRFNGLAKILFFNLKRVRSQIEREFDSAELGRLWFSEQMVAEKMGVSLRDVEMMDTRLRGDFSLNSLWARKAESGLKQLKMKIFMELIESREIKMMEQ